VPSFWAEEDISAMATILEKVRETFTPYVHDPDYVAMRTRFRGLIRSYNSLTEKATGKPKKRKVKRANTSPDTTDA
jgi:hypothetical protein